MARPTHVSPLHLTWRQTAHSVCTLLALVGLLLVSAMPGKAQDPVGTDPATAAGAGRNVAALQQQTNDLWNRIIGLAGGNTPSEAIQKAQKRIYELDDQHSRLEKVAQDYAGSEELLQKLRDQTKNMPIITLQDLAAEGVEKGIETGAKRAVSMGAKRAIGWIGLVGDVVEFGGKWVIRKLSTANIEEMLKNQQLKLIDVLRLQIAISEERNQEKKKLDQLKTLKDQYDDAFARLALARAVSGPASAHVVTERGTDAAGDAEEARKAIRVTPSGEPPPPRRTGVWVDKQQERTTKNRAAIHRDSGAKDTQRYLVDDALNYSRVEREADKNRTKPDGSAHSLVDYCNIIADPKFQSVCYSEWRALCGGIVDPTIQERCRNTVKPGGPRDAEGKIWDFCAFVKSPDGRQFCYDGFRKMIAGSTCGAVQFPPSAESYLCRERARKLPSNLPPSARTVEAKRKCKGGGLVGAINCVTEQMNGAQDNRTQKGAKKPQNGKTPAPPSASSTDKNTGITTTSVRNSDGTRTVTKTDKSGNVLSKEVVGKPPTSASSTDRKTGITTTSVRNPDGTRTVTKTDKAGNILSRERVGKSPDSASSTDRKTGATTTSVQNPDGTRAVTKTDKDGNILSREKVR